MDQPIRGIDPEKLPTLAEAYQLALRIKQSKDIPDPLELQIRLGEQPSARLLLGELLLAEQALSRAEVERLLGAPRRRFNPGEALRNLEAALQRGRGALLGWLGRLHWPRLKFSLWGILAAVAVAGLLLYPAYLVFQDRWAGALEYPDSFNRLWDSLGFLKTLVLPRYFGVVLACLLGLLIAALALPAANRRAADELLREAAFPESEAKAQVPSSQRRRGLIVLGVSALAAIALLVRAMLTGGALSFGWALAVIGILSGAVLLSTPLDAWAQRWRERRGLWAAMGLAHFALLAMLASLYSNWANPWLIGVLLALALANLFLYRRQVPAIYWVVSAAMVLYTLNLNAWWFAAVGDEFTFYREAVHIAQEGNWQLLAENLFNGSYVYGAHPFFSSLLQAVFVRIFGASNFGWRISSPYFAAVSLFFFYYLFKTFLRKPYALLACGLLAASSYIMTFGKVGYNNLQALLAFGLVLAASAYAIRKRSAFAFLLLGLAQAFCFYVYPAALYVAPLPYLLLLFYHPPTSIQRLRGWALSVIALLLFIFPLLLQPAFWEAKVAGTIAYTPDLMRDTGLRWFHLASNFVYALVSPLFNVDESHFVAGGNLDLLSAMLSFLGLAVLLAVFWRSKFLSAWLLGFAVILFLAGISHDRDYPPNTRMFLLLPFLAVMVALALAWLKANLKTAGFSEGWLRGLGAVLLALTLAFNLYQADELTYRRSTGYQNFEGLFLQLSQRYFNAEGQARGEILVFHDPQRLHIPALTELLDIYEIPYQPEQISGVDVSQLGDASIWRTAGQPEALLVVDQRLPEETRAALSELIAQHTDKLECDVKHALGDSRFMLWHPANMSWLCPPFVETEG